MEKRLLDGDRNGSSCSTRMMAYGPRRNQSETLQRPRSCVCTLYPNVVTRLCPLSSSTAAFLGRLMLALDQPALRATLMVVFCLALPLRANAQAGGNSTAVNGTILDSSGAVIPSAT